MVNVTQIGEMGAYVTLLEYDDIEVNHDCFHIVYVFNTVIELPVGFIWCNTDVRCVISTIGAGHDSAVGAVQTPHSLH